LQSAGGGRILAADHAMRCLAVFILGLVLTTVAASLAQKPDMASGQVGLEPLGFTKRFVSSSPGQGAVVLTQATVGDSFRIRFDVSNLSGFGPPILSPPTLVTNVSFTDSLPAGLIADPTAAMPHVITCNFNVNAPAGATALVFTGGTVPPVSSCALHVTVRAIAPGNQVNVTSQLTSNQAPSSAPATASINILPGPAVPAPSPSATSTPPVSTATPAPSPQPVVAQLPQRGQNPNAGGIFNGARSSTPTPFAEPLGLATAAPGGLVIRPPGTGDAGLASHFP
jgi:hypothetical protein